MHTMWVLLLLAVSVSSRNPLKPHIDKIHHHDHHVHCFSDKDLESNPEFLVQQYIGRKMHWDKYNPVKLVPIVDDAERRMRRHKRNPSKKCPEFSELSRNSDVNLRSISPWSYRIDVDENRYPQRLAFAECLCDHCIHPKLGRESASLNSVQVNQTMLVLRKKECPHKHIQEKKYAFSLEYLSVPVACTCATYRTV
ncbi:interleukin-17C [Hyperolius riggenbachi]|uniref:interleukin-17C n=1 Tax=Hyperolius riggenbachi TaxID=752182 RepID=UPI0035A2E095